MITKLRMRRDGLNDRQDEVPLRAFEDLVGGFARVISFASHFRR